jgi:hypothetical protein
MSKKVVKISRQDLIDLLVQSWRKHYEVCDDDYLATEYEQDFNEDVTIEITKGETA